MGRLISGINGPIQGKVGKISGSSWKGKPYIKGSYRKRSAKSSELETRNRKKFAAAHFWLKPIVEFLREGFKGYTNTVEGYLAAKSYLLLNAFEGVAPDLYINPALVKVSFGTLPLSSNISFAKIDDGQLEDLPLSSDIPLAKIDDGKMQLKITWNPAKVEGGNDKDQVMLLAYDIKDKDVHCNTRGQFRCAGSDIMEVYKGGTYLVYVAFVAADRSRQSDSVYLGTITV